MNVVLGVDEAAARAKRPTRRYNMIDWWKKIGNKACRYMTVDSNEKLKKLTIIRCGCSSIYPISHLRVYFTDVPELRNVGYTFSYVTWYMYVRELTNLWSANHEVLSRISIGWGRLERGGWATIRTSITARRESMRSRITSSRYDRRFEEWE